MVVVRDSVSVSKIDLKLTLARDASAAVLRRVFDAADVDGGGTIDRAEFRAPLTTLGVLSGAPARAADDAAELDAQLDAADRDGDRALDFGEFEAWFRRQGAGFGRRRVRIDSRGHMAKV